jgi:hypothetical protein
MKTRRSSSNAGVLAVLLLALMLALALFGRVFRFGRGGGRTIGQAPPSGLVYEVCDWFNAR